MKNFSSCRNSVLVAILMAFMVSQVAFSQSEAVKLAYNYPSDKPVKYLLTGKIIQTMDIMGQVMEVNIASAFGCSIKSKGLIDKNLNLEVSIDSMYQKVESPQGSVGGVVKDAMGKVFTMSITPEGKETDLTEAEKVVINIEGSGATDAAQSFNEFFPDLPAGLVSPGFTWTVADTMKTKSASNSMVMAYKSENKFDGYEDINGIKCAKISSVVSGDRVIVTQSQGMDITVKGPFTGTSIVHFSPEKGYFIKQTANSKQTGTVEITSPENMSFPVVMEMSSVNEVVK